MPRCCFTVRRVRFLEVSWWVGAGALVGLREGKKRGKKGLEMVDEGGFAGETENVGKRWSKSWVEVVARDIGCNQRPSASPIAGNLFSQNKEQARTHLCDTLLMLPPEQDGPRNATRVLALQEEGLGFAVLEAKDLAVAADVEFTLYLHS